VLKSSGGNFFEDFRPGQELIHAPARTVAAGDVSLYIALTGSRWAIHSSDVFARALGLAKAPLSDALVFNIVFGQSVREVSHNAIGNMGYAEGRFGAYVLPGDTIASRSTVIGLRETSNRKAGVVHVRTRGVNQHGEMVAEFVRWVMVAKRDPAAAAAAMPAPALAPFVSADRLQVPQALDVSHYDVAAAGAVARWGDYTPGERIDHVDGVTLEEAEHMMAARLYQNSARTHFNQHAAHATRFGRRVVYGGHIISHARALSWNGLGNAFRLAAINGGSHAAPVFAGDTLYAWSEVIERLELPGRTDLGALRLRTVVVKNRAAGDFALKDGAGNYLPAVALDLDWTVLLPR
jgi:2-methylfumaryl-CoA hydratase